MENYGHVWDEAPKCYFDRGVCIAVGHALATFLEQLVQVFGDLC